MPKDKGIRASLFVDGGNMHGAQKDMGWWIDWAKLLSRFSQDRGSIQAYYFTGAPPSERGELLARHKAFKQALIRIGYTVIDKEAKVIRDRQTREVVEVKANLDVEFTMTVLASIDWWDEAILLTGDSDFAPLVMHLRANRKKVVCVASQKSVSLEIRNASTEFIALEDLRDQIEDRKRAERMESKKGG